MSQKWFIAFHGVMDYFRLAIVSKMIFDRLVTSTSVQIMLKRNASSATAELLFHF